MDENEKEEFWKDLGRPEFESEAYDNPKNDSWAMKIFSEFCCDGCMCKREGDHVRGSEGTNN